MNICANMCVHMHVEAIKQSWSLCFPSTEIASMSRRICFKKISND